MKIHRFQIELMWLMLSMLSFGVTVESKVENLYQPGEEGGLKKDTFIPIQARPPP